MNATISSPTLHGILRIGFVALCLTPAGLTQTRYTIADLGTLGGAGSVGLGLNASGQVTGYSDSATGGQHAFLYSGVALIDLATLGGVNSSGSGINRSGQVTGTADTASGPSHAFLYSGGGMTDLGTLGGTYSSGSGINNSGQVTGDADTASGVYHAFLYGGTGMTDLGTLPYDSYSQGFGINNSGQVTGWSLFSFHAFLYSGGNMTDLGTLGGFLSKGLAVNDSGQVTGYSYTTTNALHAFLYGGGSMSDLGALDGSESAGLAINTSGQVVGFFINSVAQHAFLYTPSGGMVDLNTLIPSDSGWTLLDAFGINDAGQITGEATTPDGSTHAYLLSPIVPFSAFAAHLELDGRPASSFEIGGSFTLGTGSNGINPAIEPVTLQLGALSITIPKNSFRRSKGTFNYEGRMGGAALEFKIAPAASGFTFTAEGSRVTGLPATNSASVTLTIGDDSGTKP